MTMSDSDNNGIKTEPKDVLEVKEENEETEGESELSECNNRNGI